MKVYFDWREIEVGDFAGKLILAGETKMSQEETTKKIKEKNISAKIEEVNGEIAITIQ
jgi:hypothetical protein